MPCRFGALARPRARLGRCVPFYAANAMVKSMYVALMCLCMVMAVTSASAEEAVRAGCRHVESLPQGEMLPEGYVRAHEAMDVTALPDNYFWGNVDNINYLSTMRQQHIPQYCGSCWIHGPTSAMNDRLNIMFNDTKDRVVIAPQTMINCGHAGGCEGGNPGTVYDYMARVGLPDETCMNYLAEDLKGSCKPVDYCKTCAPGKGCWAVNEYNLVTVSGYGLVHGGDDVDAAGNVLSHADKVRAEIYANGPVSCGIHATKKFEAYKGNTIFEEKVLFPMANHEISLVGYGHDAKTGVDYFIGRNSWGTHWGANLNGVSGGWFLIRADHSNLGVADSCTFAVPKLTFVKNKGKFAEPEVTTIDPEVVREAAKTMSRAERHFAAHAERMAAVEAGETSVSSTPKGTFHNYVMPGLVRAEAPSSHVVSPLPQDYLSMGDVPTNYDFRDLNGMNYARTFWNQHNPVYCGSCWAFSTTSAFSDRVALLRHNTFPSVDLSAQVVVNCVTGGGSQGCNGGDPDAVYEYLLKTGVPEWSCQNYEAVTNECTPLNVCRDCDPKAGCSAIKQGDYPAFVAVEHGQVSGVDNIMKEVFARGPIVVGMCVTEAFENYTGGIFSDKTGCVQEDHAVSIIGFGTSAAGEDYWIVRNSWGTSWGDDGAFYITRTAGHDLGISQHGSWVVPAVPK